MDATEVPQRPLRVLIVGGGIGGLTAALALRRQGHEVVVFEKSRFASETGAALAIAPNCGRLLDRLGFHAQDYAGTKFEALAMYTGSGQLEVTAPVDPRPDSETWYLLHRAHLHEGIKSLALSPEGVGKPVKLFLSCRLENLDSCAATLTTNTGEVYTGDIIVGADGVHSWSRSFIKPDVQPFSFGLACYRWLSPGGALTNDERTQEYAKLRGTLIEWVTGERRLIHYPCVNHTLSNVAAFVPSGEVPGQREGWSQKAQKEHLIKSFKTFGPGPRALIEQAPEEELKVWEMMDMKTMTEWTKDRLVLLGDAAHPFLPFMGQGGAQAMEDACSLAALLPLGTSREDIPGRLEMWQSIRQPRVNAIQDFTRRNGRSANDSTHPRPSHQETMNMHRFCVEHDAWTVSTTKLAETQ